MTNKKRNMGCVKQNECANYGIECSECFALADVYNNYPCYKDKDLVEVIRCKYCEHRRDDEDYVGGHYCVKRPSNGDCFCKDDDFCSYGERRNNGI